LQQHPDDAGLLYSLGRQCMQAQIWGKAQSYLEHSLAKDPAADVHFALAELMERLERPVEAKAQYREAARLALEAAS
jgi:HemY protein